jgi:predicted dehydrogenase
VLESLMPIADAVRLTVPPEHRRPIAIVGAGAIVDVAHLPAYRDAGLEVCGLVDLDRERAAEVAARHGVPNVYGDLDELLADERVEVVDIAVVPWAQPEVLGAVLAAGKHALAQKPFAPDLATGRDLVATARAAGVHVAVNQ